MSKKKSKYIMAELRLVENPVFKDKGHKQSLVLQNLDWQLTNIPVDTPPEDCKPGEVQHTVYGSRFCYLNDTPHRLEAYLALRANVCVSLVYLQQRLLERMDWSFGHPDKEQAK